MDELNSKLSPRRLVLASGSKFRREMLANAGLTFDVVPAKIDEPVLRANLEKSWPTIKPHELALALAEAKARDVARRHPDAYVLGSDQILALVVDGGSKPEIFSKPHDLAEARTHIKQLRGRTHHLHTATVVIGEGAVIWQTVRTAALQMRMLDDAEVDRYLDKAGAVICETVGGYMLEGLGASLFDSVDGDHFTIVGLPLLPLLSALRRLGVKPF